MIDKMSLQNKLASLKINGIVNNIIDTEYYTDYHITFDPSVTYNRINARLKDLSLFFGGNVELMEINYNLVLRCRKNVNLLVKLGGFQDDIMNSKEGLPLAIGLDDDGKNVYYDLCKMPHLLVCGTTGSGKSVFLHDCIMSLLFSQRCELVLIDCKKVEFSFYDGMPSLACNIANDVKAASKTLKTICQFMDNRYLKMKNSKCRDFKTFNKLYPNENYMCIVIDELADIIIQDRKNIENYIVRIAQLGRACGIHLICATQKPTHDIITTLIKSNMPSRICFNVQSAIDSRVVLDCKGGESLKGNGDGLFLPIGSSQPIHIKAPYVSDNELIDITNYMRDNK